MSEDNQSRDGQCQSELDYGIVVGVPPRSDVLFASWNCGTDLNVVALSKQNKHIVMINIASQLTPLSLVSHVCISIWRQSRR